MKRRRRRRRRGDQKPSNDHQKEREREMEKTGMEKVGRAKNEDCLFCTLARTINTYSRSLERKKE